VLAASTSLRHSREAAPAGIPQLQLTAVVHQHGLDAVFSVLYTICTLDEALANAAANLRMTAIPITGTLNRFATRATPTGTLPWIV
jgi:glycerate kinase